MQVIIILDCSANENNTSFVIYVTAVGQKTIKVSEWMTWCQTCRHGGHASHLMEWFKYVSVKLIEQLNYATLHELQLPAKV